jgi:7-keto-8-aminopelargonate synthetase-like enzyme
MDSNQIINCTIKNSENIKCNIKEEIIKVYLKDGCSSGAIVSHDLLQNLEYNHAGHIGFQRQLIYTPDFKAYIVE